jgi:riboflavin synthase
MFTGIIQGIGEVSAVRQSASDRVLSIRNERLAPRLTLGASVALDGVCQTVVELSPASFTVEAMAETLRVTTLGSLKAGSRVNLELPVAAGEAMGGHFVQGHVDGLAHVVFRQSMGEAEHWRFSTETALVRQMVPKGSVALDGISLTVGPDLGRDSFEVFLIPHTLAETTLSSKKVGDPVNLETDILGKYLQRYLHPGEAGSSELSWDAIRRAGLSD